MTAVILRLAGVVVLLLAVRLLLRRNGRHHPVQQVAGDGHCQPHSGLHHHGQGHLGHPSGHVFTVAVAIYLTRMGEGRDVLASVIQRSSFPEAVGCLYRGYWLAGRSWLGSIQNPDKHCLRFEPPPPAHPPQIPPPPPPTRGVRGGWGGGAFIYLHFGPEG